jgi:hypothetical protein
MTIDAIIGLVGGFIAVLVTIMCFMLVGVQRQLGILSIKIDSKLDRSEHERETQQLAGILREERLHNTQSLMERIDNLDRKFCGHSHTNEGRIVIGGSK